MDIAAIKELKKPNGFHSVLKQNKTSNAKWNSSI